MTRSFAGRARQFQPRTRQRPPRAPAAVFASVCLAESFDGGSWPIGPDIAWGTTSSLSIGEFYHFAGSFFYGDDTDPTQRTLHVVDNAAALRAADSSYQTGPPPTPPIFLTLGWDLGWRTVMGFARTATDLASTDVTVTTTIGGLLTPFASEIYLIARSDADYVDDDFPGQYYSGYVVLFIDEYIELDMQYVSPDFSGDLGFTTITYAEPVDHFAPGDELSLTVTGTGASTLVDVKVNGVTALTADATDIEAAMFGSDTIADAPLGKRHGFGLQGFGISYESVDVNESFNKADGDPVGPDLSWASMIPGGHDTITSNTLALDASNVYASAVTTSDHPHIRGAGFTMQTTLAGLDSGFPAGTRFTMLVDVDGTDYTDWTGIGLQWTYVGLGGGGGQVWDIQLGELNPGDATGALTNTYGPGNVDFSGQFYSAIGSGMRIDWTVWAGPVDGSQIGDFNSTIRLNGLFDSAGPGDGSGPLEDVNHTTATAAGPDHHFGMVLFAPSGATSFQRPRVDSIKVFKPSFDLWDAGTQDDVLSLSSWEACRA